MSVSSEVTRWGMRRKQQAARDMATPDAVMTVLASDPDVGLRRMVAARTCLLPDAAVTALFNAEGSQWAADGPAVTLAGNPNLTDSQIGVVVTRALQAEGGGERALVALARVPAALTRQLLQEGREDVLRQTTAGIPEDILRAWMARATAEGHDMSDVLQVIARRDGVSDGLLREVWRRYEALPPHSNNKDVVLHLLLARDDLPGDVQASIARLSEVASWVSGAPHLSDAALPVAIATHPVAAAERGDLTDVSLRALAATADSSVHRVLIDKHGRSLPEDVLHAIIATNPSSRDLIDLINSDRSFSDQDWEALLTSTLVGYAHGEVGRWERQQRDRLLAGFHVPKDGLTYPATLVAVAHRDDLPNQVTCQLAGHSQPVVAWVLLHREVPLCGEASLTVLATQPSDTRRAVFKKDQAQPVSVIAAGLLDRHDDVRAWAGRNAGHLDNRDALTHHSDGKVRARFAKYAALTPSEVVALTRDTSAAVRAAAYTQATDTDLLQVGANDPALTVAEAANQRWLDLLATGTASPDTLALTVN